MFVCLFVCLSVFSQINNGKDLFPHSDNKPFRCGVVEEYFPPSKELMGTKSYSLYSTNYLNEIIPLKVKIIFITKDDGIGLSTSNYKSHFEKMIVLLNNHFNTYDTLIKGVGFDVLNSTNKRNFSI